MNDAQREDKKPGVKQIQISVHHGFLVGENEYLYPRPVSGVPMKLWSLRLILVLTATRLAYARIFSRPSPFHP